MFQVRRSRTWLLLLITFVLILGVVAALQYRWLGAVSDAEIARMRTDLDASAQNVVDGVDDEARQVFDVFRVTGRGVDRSYEQWLQGSADVRLVHAVYTTDGDRISKLDPTTGMLHEVPWPDELEEVHRRIDAIPADDAVHFLRASPPLIAEIPALLVPIDRNTTVAAHGGNVRGADLGFTFAVVVLDRDYLSTKLIPRLAGRYLPDYDVAVVRHEDVLYRSNPDWPSEGERRQADGEWPILKVRAANDPQGPLGARPGDDGRAPRAGDDRRPPRGDADGDRPRRPRPLDDRPPADDQGRGDNPPPRDGLRPPGGEWHLVVLHRGFSLEQTVTLARWRNLALSALVLLVLAVALVTMSVLLRRSQTLAQQQLEFVAGVTHELNTPLAAITSAGQNLADGVISEPEHVGRYGALIVKEGRRLSDMVTQVLEFAAMQNPTAPQRRREAVDPAQVVDDALAECRFLIEQSGVTVEKSIARDLPLLAGDLALLVRAVQNLVMNAVKYGGSAHWVGIRVARERRGVFISVEDRGPGVSREDAAHVFEPFYRGSATANVVRGSGIGLALVRSIVRAHGGRVDLASPRGGGARFTIHLPIASGDSEANGQRVRDDS